MESSPERLTDGGGVLVVGSVPGAVAALQPFDAREGDEPSALEAASCLVATVPRALDLLATVPSVPIVAVASDADELADALDAGVTECLVGPVDGREAELRERVRAAVRVAETATHGEPPTAGFDRFAAAAVARERRVLERVLDATPVGIVVTDAAGDLVRANAEAQTILGRSETAIEARWRDTEAWGLVDREGEPLDRDAHPIVSVLRTEEPAVNRELGVSHPELGRVWVLANAVPVFDADDELEFVIGAFLDVSQRRRFDDELRLSRERLSVLNRVLRHDIRTKANIASGYAELLREEHDPAYLDAIEEVADDLANISETVGNVEAALSADVEAGAVDLADLVERCLAQARERFPDAHLVSEVDGPLPVSGTDHLCLAIEELIDNAVRHAEHDTPHVTVSASLGGLHAELRVADDGPGIPEPEREVIEEGTETPLDHASGLGLWLVSWVVSRYGGEVRIEDNDPEGTVVAIRLLTP
ncbi:sensor histidine kinase [Natronomonas sp. EA1]|uniref:sensor histidine kinase n=1 Tax=Natronomonas sp. EA1 TaxID=3421655 RepID=UPI003EBC32D2